MLVAVAVECWQIFLRHGNTIRKVSLPFLKHGICISGPSANGWWHAEPLGLHLWSLSQLSFPTAYGGPEATSSRAQSVIPVTGQSDPISRGGFTVKHVASNLLEDRRERLLVTIISMGAFASGKCMEGTLWRWRYKSCASATAGRKKSHSLLIRSSACPPFMSRRLTSAPHSTPRERQEKWPRIVLLRWKDTGTAGASMAVTNGKIPADSTYYPQNLPLPPHTVGRWVQQLEVNGLGYHAIPFSCDVTHSAVGIFLSRFWQCAVLTGQLARAHCCVTHHACLQSKHKKCGLRISPVFSMRASRNRGCDTHYASLPSSACVQLGSSVDSTPLLLHVSV